MGSMTHVQPVLASVSEAVSSDRILCCGYSASRIAFTRSSASMSVAVTMLRWPFTSTVCSPRKRSSASPPAARPHCHAMSIADAPDAEIGKSELTTDAPVFPASGRDAARERVPERPCTFRDRLDALRDEVAKLHEAVHHAVVARQRVRHAGCGERL